VIIDESVRARLEALIPLAPLHQPHNLAAVRAAEDAFPGAVQVACFDTAFHHGHAFESEAFAIPRRYFEAGVRRYGFHGLSYEYLSGALAQLADPAPSRVVFAHLGAGASLCAVRDGRSVDTTMGFSALDGLPMATRCGQIDPGVLLHLMETEGLDAAALSDLLYRESGLKGLSGLSGDMRVLEDSDAAEAKQAIACFVERCRRAIAAMAAALEGLDVLVFAGGMGENSPRIRSEVCSRLGWLGVDLDDKANAAARGAPARISAAASEVEVWMIPTDEEAVLARAAARLARG
jgi:acetate kinase